MAFFFMYFINNIIPKKTNIKFDNISTDNSFVKNYTIENKNGRIAIYLNTSDEIFKQYDYHSYISGDATGRKINLQMYLICEKDSSCYKIKTYCYDYSDMENLKFLGYYYNKFIRQNEKYKLAIYVPENEKLYITDIQI